MKKIQYLLMLAAGASILSCTKYLDVKPQGKILPETDEEFASVLNYRLNNIETGSYDDVIGNVESVLNFEAYTDNLDVNIATGEMPKYAGDKIRSNDDNYENWYAVIKDCNIIIGEMEPRSSELSRQLLASCYALKGVCYYNLIRNYCEAYNPSTADTQLGVPIVDKFDVEAVILRSDLRSTVDYTISLFKKSLQSNVSDPTYFFTPNIVKAFLAKTYFWAQDWDEARTLCQELLAKPEFALASGEAYINMIQDQYKKLPGVVTRSYINGNNALFDSEYKFQMGYSKSRPVSKGLIDLFSADQSKDVRYAISFSAKRQNMKNICARVREGELQLMVAECYYHTGNSGEALNALNTLRSMRITGVTAYTEETLPQVDANTAIQVNAKGEPLDKLLSAIFDERRKELFMEGDRWFELKRNGSPEWWIISDGLKYTTRKYMYTFPISRKDVDLLEGKLIQNEGYIK